MSRLKLRDPTSPRCCMTATSASTPTRIPSSPKTSTLSGSAPTLRVAYDCIARRFPPTPKRRVRRRVHCCSKTSRRSPG
ncbi:MAG: hypothetical protein ACLSVD_10360 [Eggerthellaceae bacterium]